MTEPTQPTEAHPTDSPEFQEQVDRVASDNPIEMEADHAVSHGPGDLSSLPESDFISFATDEVHQEESA